MWRGAREEALDMLLSTREGRHASGRAWDPSAQQARGPPLLQGTSTPAASCSQPAALPTSRSDSPTHVALGGDEAAGCSLCFSPCRAPGPPPPSHSTPTRMAACPASGARCAWANGAAGVARAAPGLARGSNGHIGLHPALSKCPGALPRPLNSEHVRSQRRGDGWRPLPGGVHLLRMQEVRHRARLHPRAVSPLPGRINVHPRSGTGVTASPCRAWHGCGAQRAALPAGVLGRLVARPWRRASAPLAPPPALPACSFGTGMGCDGQCPEGWSLVAQYNSDGVDRPCGSQKGVALCKLCGRPPCAQCSWEW